MPTRSDRVWHCPELAEGILRRLVARYGPDLLIVQGGADGVDLSFVDTARLLGLAVEEHGADWSKGPAAGPIRNQQMADAGARLCIAVHRYIARSKGTKDAARRAIEAGIPTYLIDSEEARPVRLGADDPRLLRSV